MRLGDDLWRRVGRAVVDEDELPASLRRKLRPVIQRVCELNSAVARSYNNGEVHCSSLHRSFVNVSLTLEGNVTVNLPISQNIEIDVTHVLATSGHENCKAHSRVLLRLQIAMARSDDIASVKATIAATSPIE